MFKRFISKVILITYVHQIIISSILWSNNVLVQVRPLQDHGFELEVEVNKQIHKMQFTSSQIQDQVWQEHTAKQLSWLNELEITQDRIKCSADGLALTFDWLGNLRLDGLSNDLIVKPLHFTSANKITLGNNLYLKDLTLVSPKMINSGADSFIENLRLVNDIPQQNSNFINDHKLTVKNLDSQGLNLINMGEMQILEGGRINLHGYNFNNFSDIFAHHEVKLLNIDHFFKWW